MTRQLPILLISFLAGGCAMQPSAPQQPSSIVELSNMKAEQSLLAGIKQYEEGNYSEAETKLQAALAAKLTFSKDQVYAYKYLAFIYCGSNRTVECADAFRHILAIDPHFELSPRERGHPVWGPLFQTVHSGH